MGSKQEENVEKQDPAAPDDDDLIAAIKGGRASSFEILIQRYERRVFSFIRRMVYQREDAEELAQDCFIRAFKAIPEYQSRGRFCSWLFTIARNLSKNHLAQKYNVGKHVSPNPLPDNVRAEPSVGSGEDEVQEWLSSLPEDYRTVMSLKYVADLSCAEIAEVEGMSESAVKQRLHRGREMIRERLEGEKTSDFLELK